jgi:hypothetical protein
VDTPLPYSKPELEDAPISKSSYLPDKAELSETVGKAPPSELAGDVPAIHELPGSSRQPYEAGSSDPENGALSSANERETR